MPVLLGNNQFARLLGTCKPGHRVHIFVIDAANAIFLARQRGILETPAGVNQPGIKLTQANGPAEINWDGEVWYFANAASVAFEGSIE